ncbi:MAG TPA: hypothetical protein DF613_04145 [Lachnospiraceae bacterium]|nr:hypothetical protein [Lachnospiraceae bacterium]
MSRRNSLAPIDESAYYYDGNTVRVGDLIPEEEQQPEIQRRLSKKTRKNRAKALSVNRGYVVFLAVVSTVAVSMCVSYIQLKTEITSQSKKIAAKQTELADIRADNDALENSLYASVDLDEVYRIATQKLGMHYPDQEQIVQYSTDGSGYLRQYTDIPDADK